MDRILFLTADPAAITAQLAGATLGRAAAGPLRDDVSTDEITPLPALVNFDERLAVHAYTGLKCGGRLPIAQSAIRAAGITVTVAGARYGKGSSREHSPVAERMAGIRLVIAESFERIYRQNADNVGLLTSTDMGLVDRIQAGETIGLEETDRRPRRPSPPPSSAPAACSHTARPRMHGATLATAGQAGPQTPAAQTPAAQTLATKILARHMLATPDAPATLEPGQGAFVRPGLRFIHDVYTAMARFMLHQAFGPAPALHDPATIVTFEDHFSYAHRSQAHLDRGLLPRCPRPGRSPPRLRRRARPARPRTPGRRRGLRRHLPRPRRRAVRPPRTAHRRPPTATRPTAAPSAASPSGSAPPTWPTPCAPAPSASPSPNPSASTSTAPSAPASPQRTSSSTSSPAPTSAPAQASAASSSSPAPASPRSPPTSAPPSPT